MCSHTHGWIVFFESLQQTMPQSLFLPATKICRKNAVAVSVRYAAIDTDTVALLTNSRNSFALDIVVVAPGPPKG